MSEKMAGAIAKLETRNEKGVVIDSQIVFVPKCEWYITPLRDGYAETKFEDIGAVIDEFGIDVAEKVFNGEIVEVEREIPEGFRQTSCPLNVEFFKNSYRIYYPYKDGTKETLSRLLE